MLTTTQKMTSTNSFGRRWHCAKPRRRLVHNVPVLQCITVGRVTFYSTTTSDQRLRLLLPTMQHQWACLHDCCALIAYLCGKAVYVCVLVCVCECAREGTHAPANELLRGPPISLPKVSSSTIWRHCCPSGRTHERFRAEPCRPVSTSGLIARQIDLTDERKYGTDRS